MSYDFMLKWAALAVVCVSAQVVVGRVVRRYRTEVKGEPQITSPKRGMEELRWAAATLIIFLLLALLGEAVWNRWRVGRATHTPAAGQDAGSLSGKVEGIKGVNDCN